MAAFRVNITYERTVTFLLEADDVSHVEGFLDSDPVWAPADVPGLIETVGDEFEVEYSIDAETEYVPNFRVTGDLRLEELGFDEQRAIADGR